MNTHTHNEAESTLTDRYQTTVPEVIRRALQLGKRDKIHYSIRPDGEVVLSRVEAQESDDPVLGHFLRFLAKDLAGHPERVQSIGQPLVQRIRDLVEDVEIDLDAPLPEEENE